MFASTRNHPPRWRLGVTLLLLLFGWSLGTQAGPRIESWHTSNGARVLFVATPELPMLDLRITFDAGSARDGESPGIGAMVNGLMIDGAGDWDADQIAERFESVGAEVRHDSLRDMSFYSLRSLTDPAALQPALETLAQVIGAPSFEADDIERNRGIMLANLRQQAQDPRAVASRRFYAELFGSHPYAIHSDGTEESIGAMTREQILAQYQRYYVASNATLALVGQIDRARAEAIAEQVTAGLARGEIPPPLPAVAELTEARSLYLPFPSSQSHIYIGQPGMRRGDPDYFPLYVGNHILGGSGLVSRLSNEVREQRGLSYSVYSYFLPMRQPGPFILGAQTRNASAEEAVEVMEQTLRRFVAEGPTEEELQRSRQNITGSFPVKLAGNGDIVDYLAMMAFYDLPLSYLDDFVGKIEAVTAEQIRDAFRRRVHPDQLLQVVLGQPPEATPATAATGD